LHDYPIKKNRLTINTADYRYREKIARYKIKKLRKYPINKNWCAWQELKKKNLRLIKKKITHGKSANTKKKKALIKCNCRLNYKIN